MNAIIRAFVLSAIIYLVVVLLANRFLDAGLHWTGAFFVGAVVAFYAWWKQRPTVA